ncbi:DUF3800 domain-containing protein [Bradyrhizobium sp. I71]|uniref:DUF3800 domain-containing protein n=1 Tax=Bradyrhizobium sp. I71 TaxID=2590772 RepID=UPI001EF9B1EC|nr:DUF3800 domain-containing protein [Bradyrhizobium sp. I71]ULL01226.1 DUF3800 domain-containing protein [Bradyrhizobium sp. I71]
MHFFYLDETGCTGADLASAEQPIFVIGGLSVTDEGWRKTTLAVNAAFSTFFDGAVPDGFELHAHELASGTGPFSGRTRAERNGFAHTLLDLVAERKHAVHLIAIDKAKLLASTLQNDHAKIDCKIPYLLGFNYLITYIEKYVREQLGRSARGMIILDHKEMFQPQIDSLTHYRRYEIPQARQLKWIVEFSYPVDSTKHPLIQLSDLVIFLARKFLECEGGYRDEWPVEAKNFFAACYEKVHERTYRTTLVESPGVEENVVHSFLSECQATHRAQWRQRYGLKESQN